MNEHVDDDGFAELSLNEAPDAKTAAHLESCAACREELARFRDSVESFSMASLAWSEEKSEALPALRPSAKVKGAKAGGNGTPRLVPALSFAAVLGLLVIGLTVPMQKMHVVALHHGDTAHLADDDPAGLNSPEQIAKDNQLMADVNYELTHSQAVLLSQYHRQRSARAGAGVTETGETGKRSR